MNINGVGFSFPQNSVEGSTKAGGNTKDVEQQIDTLEKKKAELEKKLEKEDSPFALQQSKECESIEKEIEQLDKQIQELKTSKGSNPASEVSSNMENNIDEFIRSADQTEQPSAGIYSISSDKNGGLVISLDQQSTQKGSPEEEQSEDGLNINKLSGEVTNKQEEDN